MSRDRPCRTDHFGEPKQHPRSHWDRREESELSVKRDERGGHDHDHDHSHDHDCGHDHDHDHDSPPGPSFEELTDGIETYSGHGVRFQYPGHWELGEESNPEQVTITVQSPGTTFWTLSLFADQPDPDQIEASVMAAYEEMYEEMDVYESDVLVLGAPAIAREIDFVCLDLVSTAALIIFQTMNHTVLVMFQGEDRELETTRPLLESMTRSLLCDME